MSLDGMARDFATRLAALTPIIDVEVQWPQARLRARTFLGDHDPPPALITSARAVVFKGRRVVVVRDRNGVAHIEPGGGLEPGETVETALRRELAEETGWTVGPLRPLGFNFLEPLTARPPGSARRWGPMVHPLFVAEALAYDRRARDMSQVEVGSRLVSIRRALTEIEPWRAALLTAAIARRDAPP